MVTLGLTRVMVKSQKLGLNVQDVSPAHATNWAEKGLLGQMS
jgi:hypothetical protein